MKRETIINNIVVWIYIIFAIIVTAILVLGLSLLFLAIELDNTVSIILASCIALAVVYFGTEAFQKYTGLRFKK